MTRPSPGSRPRSDRAAAGLGIALALLLCTVIIAGFGTHAARTAADDMKNRYLPFMETALTLEALVYEAVFHVSMFGISGDLASYSGARIHFTHIREAADRLAREAGGLHEGQPLARDMEVLRDLAVRLDLVVEKKRTLNDQVDAEQGKLQKTADDMGEILLDLQARLASARAGKGNDIDLDEKARLLVLSGFSLAVAEVTGRVLAAGVAKSAEDLARAQAYFTQRWEEARDAYSAAASLPSPEGISTSPRSAEKPASDLETLVESYAGILNTIRFNLEESARVTSDRVEVSGKLAVLTRKLVLTIETGMAAVADRTDTALRGATAALFACGLLACVLAVGAVLIFARSRSIPSA